MAYWCGGSREQRAQADRELGTCVGEAALPLLGFAMSTSTCVAGQPWMPFYWRRGYSQDWSLTHDAP
jgi:hypothetical protein